MSEWSKFKTVGRDEKKESKAGLIGAIFSCSALCGAVGGGIGFAAVLYIANSEDHKRSIVFAESHNVLPIEAINGIVAGCAVFGLILGAIIGMFVFLPGVFKKEAKKPTDDPFEDEDMKAS